MNNNVNGTFGGLWLHASGKSYISATISRKSLEKMLKNCSSGGIRMVLIKNRYKKIGDNRPKFLFSFIKGTEGTEIKHSLPAISLIKDEDKIDAISVSDAVDIARECLHDLEYGYSIDDLVVEVARFMEERSFWAVELEDEDAEQYD